MNFGFVSVSGSIQGFATDVEVTSSVSQLPALGVGPLASGSYYPGSATHDWGLRVEIASPLSSTLTFDLKNLSTGNTLGSGTISAGSLVGTGGGSLYVNQNDNLALLLSVSGSSEVIPALQWHAG